MTGEIVIIANDVVPGMVGPVAAPGLRAWGLAQGLRSHGYRPIIIVDADVLGRAWEARLPPPTPRGTLSLRPSQFVDFIRSRRPMAVVMTNSNHIDALGDLNGIPLVYDFFAPKMLELAEKPDSAARSAELATVRARKLRGLSASRAVIVNGAKKMPYVEHWLHEAGNAEVPKAVVNMPLAPVRSTAPEGGPVRIVVSGYLQPWSAPGAWADVLVPLLKEGRVVLHLLVANHWGGRGADLELPKMFRALGSLPNVRTRGLMDLADFRGLLASCHLSLDLFARNPERELAFVTRTAMAISCGMAAIHVPFTEVSEMIDQYGAGWLVDSGDATAIENVLLEATERPDLLSDKREGARSLAQHLEPHHAVAPLAALLGDL